MNDEIWLHIENTLPKRTAFWNEVLQPVGRFLTEEIEQLNEQTLSQIGLLPRSGECLRLSSEDLSSVMQSFGQQLWEAHRESTKQLEPNIPLNPIHLDTLWDAAPADGDDKLLAGRDQFVLLDMLEFIATALAFGERLVIRRGVHG